jgi:WD40 repeat protein
MNIESAKSAVLALLRDKGRATNSALLAMLGQDRALLAEVREELILDDLAKDKDGVGLIYLGEPGVRAPVLISKACAEPTGLEPDEIDQTQVFISYGHADAFEFASRLRNDLVQRGYMAWMDSKTLQGGTNWVIEIEMGIARSFALIAVLSPHATRAGGWCPKEVLLAHNDGKHIVPVRPFNGNIRSLLLVDLHQVDFSASYEEGLRELIATLEDYCKKTLSARPSALPSSPAEEPTVLVMPPPAKQRFADISGIRPFNFAREISTHLDLFVGRRWLKSKVEHWLAHEKHPVFVLIGAPGIGKSAIACWLSQELDRQVISLHLCSSRVMRTLDPYEYVAALVRQLAEMLPEFETALGDADVSKRRPTAALAFEELVVAPLQTMTPPLEPRLLIVDSLDEALIQNGETILDVIVACAPKLPAWLRLLATTRPEQPVLDRIRGLNSFELQADQRENQQDVADFLAEAVRQEELSLILGATADDVARRVTGLANGNFLYARMAVQALQRGELKVADLQQLSGGLEDFYSAAFALHLAEPQEYEQRIRPLLEVLSAAFGPLALSTLQAALGVDTLELRRRLAPLRLYLRQIPSETESLITFAHKSLRDWLTTPNLSGRYYLDPIRGHHRLSESLLNRWSVDIYAVRYLPRHLIAAERWDALIGDDKNPGPLTDLLFIQAKCEAGLVHELVSDYNAALATLPEFREENERNQRHDAAMMTYNQALREYAVVRCDWWFAKERGEMRPEPLYPPLPVELRDEDRHVIPEESSSRAARLRYFINFVSEHLSLLEKFPENTAQLAYNWTDTGPVEAQAEVRLQGVEFPMIKRSPRPPCYPLRPQCLRTLQGHADGVRSVSVSPDGRRAISGSDDKTLRVWDMETGQCLLTLEDHAYGVLSVRVSPDGRRAVSGSSDNTLRVWDFETGQCLHILKGHADRVRSVSVSRDGRRAVSASDDNTLRVWDLETGQCLATLEGYSDWVLSVSISPDGRRAVSGSTDKTLRVWNLDTGQCLATLEGHLDWVLSVSVTPDGRRAVSGSDDNTLRVWDLETGQCLRILKGHNYAVISVSVTPDGRRAISGSDDKTLRVWDLETGQCLSTLKGHADLVSSVSVSGDGQRAVSGSFDKTLRVWDLETGQCLLILEGHAYGVRSVSVSPDGRRAVSGSSDKTLRVWDFETGQCLRILEGHSDRVRSVSVIFDGRRAVSASDDKTLRVWDLEPGQCLLILEGHVDRVRSVSVSPDGRRAVSGSFDKTLRVWDLETGRCLATLEGHAYGIRSVNVSADGRRVISGSYDKTLRVWDLETGRCLATLEGHASGVLSVSVSADGRRAVSGSEDKTLRVWDLETGQCLATLEGHGAAVNSVSVSPDGKRAASGSSDKTLRVWDMESGKCMAVYHCGAVASSVVFSLVGDHIVCGTADGQMHFLSPVNFPPSGPPIITPVRLWLFGDNNASGRWDDHLTCRCVHCCKRFEAPPVKPGHEPHLEKCPHCNGILMINPFVADLSL